jgi:hypothetical protein
MPGESKRRNIFHQTGYEVPRGRTHLLSFSVFVSMTAHNYQRDASRVLKNVTFCVETRVNHHQMIHRQHFQLHWESVHEAQSQQPRKRGNQ